jgi:SAM-dependent methyltransferase
MGSSRPDLLADVSDYYSRAIRQHGATARGVDWNSETSQTLRFQQLCRLIVADSVFSVIDLGCGYGALYDYLSENYANFGYHGYDVSVDMIAAASERLRPQSNVELFQTSEPLSVCDYAVASGLFNVRLNRLAAEWQGYILQTIATLDRCSSRGFAFNCLTSYSDADRMRADLHYANPLELFDVCKTRYGRNVALLHDYGLYEFTILVRKSV